MLIKLLFTLLSISSYRYQCLSRGNKLLSNYQVKSSINDIIFEDKIYGTNETINQVKLSNYLKSNNNNLNIFNNFNKLQFKQLSIMSSINSRIKSTFLPEGYPNTTPKEYRTYQTWNLIQDSCSYLRGILSTRALLEGFGVGRSDITALQAAIAWIQRDGVSMLGGLLFTSFSSSNFNQNIKSWRLFADFINNIGITLDMIAPFAKSRQTFLIIVCIASLCKSLCGIAAGSANAAIAEHWGGQRGNIADVLAKNNAQHTLISLLGLCISIPFAKFANISTRRLFTCYFLLTICHIYSNIRAMRILALRSINMSRYHIIVRRYISNFIFNQTSDNTNELLSLQSISSIEPLFTTIIPGFLRVDRLINRNYNDITNSNVKYWYTPTQLLNQNLITLDMLRDSLLYYNNSPYYIIPNKSYSYLYICMSNNCNKHLQAQAIFEATIQSYIYKNSINSTSHYKDIVDKSKSLTNQYFNSFFQLLKELEWDVDRLQLFDKTPNTFNIIT